MRPCWSLLLLLPGLAWGNSPQSAAEWLDRMADAAHKLNYEGTFIYEHAGRLQTMQVYHGTDGKSERERLVALDGASREVVRRDGKVTCILPDHNTVMEDEAGTRPPLPISVPTRIDQLQSFYEPQVSGSERVAGRTARKVVIAPRDEFRYGQHLWLDETSGLLLKAELRDEKGRVVEQLVFTRLKVHDKPLPAELLEPQTATKELGRAPPREKSPHKTAAESPWAVTALPAGFREELRRQHRMPGVESPVEHRVFTDGLASVSVFIESGKSANAAAPRTVRKGAINAYTRYVDDHKVTVLGDVPEATVRLIGDGVAAQQGSATGD